MRELEEEKKKSGQVCEGFSAGLDKAAMCSLFPKKLGTWRKASVIMSF